MDKIIEALVTLLPFAELFANIGINSELSVAIATILDAELIVGISFMIKAAITRIKNCRAAKDLAPYFNYQAVKSARKYFIPTRSQNFSPTLEDEPEFSHKYVFRNPLIPFLINNAFNEKKASDKFYLVLADSGMGKTTFMLNLYIKYTAFFNFWRKYNILLFPLGDTRVLDRIKEIKPEDVKNTILLLDAFDEDKKLIPPDEPDGLADDDRFRRRLDEIIDTVRDFREVVITSRTQYFPGQEDKPYELKIPRFGNDGYHTLAKLYLSPFDEKEIRRYLHKKYGIIRFWNRGKKRVAARIVSNSPKLMVRPMLLSYIDLLVDGNHTFQTTAQIYETLVNKWIQREAEKRRYKKTDQEKFKCDLREYSRLVALKIFHQRKSTDTLKLIREDAVLVAQKHNIDLSGYEITGQSLLTRDAEGSWKYAHKSIFEYYIAREVVRDFKLYKVINWNGLDMTRSFLEEIYPFFSRISDLKQMIDLEEFCGIKGGTFFMGSPEAEKGRLNHEKLHPVYLDDFCLAKYPVTIEQFEKFVNTAGYKKADGWQFDVNGKKQMDNQHPVLNVSWYDAQAYCDWRSKESGGVYRLPTEAEWEYACRAGTVTPYHSGEKLTLAQANFNGKKTGTTPVGKYDPNAWGLYDMHGNVWEWCQDWYGEKYYAECKRTGTVMNPEGPRKGSYRVLRGGGWSDLARGCRSASRSGSYPGNRDGGVGFRPVFVPQYRSAHSVNP